MQRIRLTEGDLHRIIRKCINEDANAKICNKHIDNIYRAIRSSGIGNKVYHDDYWSAKDDYDSIITRLGGEFDYRCKNGGYTDYDKDDHMPRSKKYDVRITFDDGSDIRGYMKFMASGSVDDPFSAYDTMIELHRYNESWDEEW